ncbi:MAG: phosphoribosylaminoimidazolesuccinocarboxamide synthase [Nitrososphaeraceae archaeon]|jgi:phosphoribosylaminoimidazole-succinocarboxamide synthase
MKLLRRGKVKDIYDLENGNILLHFSDRISAFDIKMTTTIPKKGEVLCKFGEFWFNSLDTRHHMLELQDKDKMIAKNMDMIPIECIVRGYFYGSLLERYNKETIHSIFPSTFEPVTAAKLIEPIFDPTTKSEEHDKPITESELVSSRLLSKKEFDYLKETSITLYKKMSIIADRAGFIIADVKFEFGREPKTGEILLGDSLGPDEYRLWLRSDYLPGNIQESYDKQLLRDWLIKIGFKDKIDRFAEEGKKPDPPILAPELVDKLSNRYVVAYEKITGRKL